MIIIQEFRISDNTVFLIVGVQVEGLGVLWDLVRCDWKYLSVNCDDIEDVQDATSVRDPVHPHPGYDGSVGRVARSARVELSLTLVSPGEARAGTHLDRNSVVQWQAQTMLPYNNIQTWLDEWIVVTGHA